MSGAPSTQSLAQTEQISQKKRRKRIPASCEQCRARKVKCEFGEGSRCARCILFQLECSGKRGTKAERYMRELDQKVHQIQFLLEKKGPEREPSPSLRPESSTLASHTAESELDDQENTDELFKDEDKTFTPVFLGCFTPGSSSCLGFMDAVLPKVNSKTRQVTVPFGVGTQALTTSLYDHVDPPKQYSFPDPDLLEELIDHYFENINVYYWLLHRPTFDANIASGLHLKDPKFAEVVLLVAAAGSRYSQDPRVLVDNSGGNWLSSGWQWFSQVQLLQNTLLEVLSLYELQKIFLSTVYVYCGNNPHLAWSLAGIGLRLAQGMGIHHWKKPDHIRPLEFELWKRAFWSLLCIDRFGCSALGRPCYTHEEDFDIELPTICDEEFWDTDHVKQMVEQPPKPSKQMFLIGLIRLSDILAFTLRMIYSVGKFQTFLSKSDPRWRENALQRIDSALNKWHDIVPEYLRWPISRSNTTFYAQSSVLYLTYHSVQIQAHRPFIPSLVGRSELSLSSLVICANAARSSSHIFENLIAQRPMMLQPFCAPLAFTAGLFLLIYIWECQKFGHAVDRAKELKNVRHCLNYLRCLEPRFATTGLIANMIERLLLQEEQPSSAPVKKPSQSHHEQSQATVMDPQPSISCQTTVETAAHASSLLSPDIGGLFKAYLGDVAAVDSSEGNWSLNDISMLQNLGTADNFYQNVFASFNDNAWFNSLPMNGTAQENMPIYNGLS